MQSARGSRGGHGKRIVRRCLLSTGVALLVVAGGLNPFGASAASLRSSSYVFARAYAPVSANPVTVGSKAVVTNTDGDPIRVREGAGTQYDRIAWAREGDVVGVLDGPVAASGTNWYKIQAASATGWMMAQYLRGTGASAAPAAAPVAARSGGNVRVVNTDGDRLRVRSAPNTGGSVIGYLDPGATGTIEEGPITDAAGIVWYRVSASSLKGWCMAQYLAKVDAPQANTAPAPAPAQTEPAANTPPAARPSPEQLRQWIEEARAMYPYPETADKMWRVMMCESGGNPSAVGSGRYIGLFQYLPGTWSGAWNPYRNSSIYDARAQIFATARAWSLGMQDHWSCY
jgi:uncharacterized protein YgiM (DUF1202 family)